MYPETQIPNGGLTLLGAVALSFLMPGWVAAFFGFGEAHAALLAWMTGHEGIPLIVLWLCYGAFGFGLLVGIAIGAYACPHCGNRAGTVYCGDCEETICAGRVRSLPNGGRAFACHDACGATGELEACSHVHGAGESRAGNGWLQLPKRPAQAKALPGRARLRLPAPRSR